MTFAKRRAQTNKGRETAFMSEFLSQGDRDRRRARRYKSSKKVQKKQQLAPSKVISSYYYYKDVA